MFSKDLEYAIGQCYKHAREARHEYMTVEHLLLALTKVDSPAKRLLELAGIREKDLLTALQTVRGSGYRFSTKGEAA